MLVLYFSQQASVVLYNSCAYSVFYYQNVTTFMGKNTQLNENALFNENTLYSGC